MIRLRSTLAAGLAAASVLAVAGCGVNSDPEMIRGDQVAASAREMQQAQETKTIRQRRANLPRRSSDEVALSVPAQGSASAAAVRSLRAEKSPVDFGVVVQPTDQGFADLCAGSVDVLQSNRQITPAELAQCDQNGLAVSRKVTLGYATAVLVTENGRDIGGDCLTLAAVRSMLSRGSTITNWRQIGFATQGFAAAAPPAASPATGVVAIKAFGRPIGSVALTDFRGDLKTYARYNDLSDWVTNQDRIDQLDRETRAYNRSIARQRRRSDIEEIRRAEAIAARKVVRQIDAENAARKKAKKAVSDPKALEADNAARVRSAKRRARLDVIRKQNAAVNLQTSRYRADRVTQVFSSGRLGVVPYTFYELHSDVLRPLEIDARRKASTDQPDCKFPSQQTIVNGTYPLILPVYLYGDSRVLRTASVRVLLTRLFSQNATLTRQEDLTGLSAADLVTTRRGLGLAPIDDSTDGTTTSRRTPTGPVNATPNLQPGEIPGVNSSSAETP
ncbi:substrate-binding domain-containing protein [Patulibacter sp. NPDC049589]|uniref:substrate-binding domain-containing protein n=1 Tax=Patulibacter sp. NPDC049589 TaxID=3154731 RepID=UPI00343E2399